MRIDILLSKYNREILRNMCLRLFADFKNVKISKKTVIFKRRWYSMRKVQLQVVDLVLLHIPQAINDLYDDKDLNCPFDYKKEIESAVEYFGLKIVDQDFIQFLQYQIDNLDISTCIYNAFDPEPFVLQEQEEVHVEEAPAVERVFNDSMTYFYNLMNSIIEEMQPCMRIVHLDTESTSRSPPIRAPVKNTVTLLSA